MNSSELTFGLHFLVLLFLDLLMMWFLRILYEFRILYVENSVFVLWSLRFLWLEGLFRLVVLMVWLRIFWFWFCHDNLVILLNIYISRGSLKNCKQNKNNVEFETRWNFSTVQSLIFYSRDFNSPSPPRCSSNHFKSSPMCRWRAPRWRSSNKSWASPSPSVKPTWRIFFHLNRLTASWSL